MDENEDNRGVENEDMADEVKETVEQEGNEEEISKEENPGNITADSDSSDDDPLDLYCSACKKNFKTVKS